MIFATAADVLAAGAAISYEYRRYITTFGAIAVAGWVCNNVIPVTTARAAAESDSDSDEEEDDAAHEEQQDELVALEEAVPNNAPKTRRKYSIAHEDIVSGRVVYFDTDLEDINATDLVQLSCVASDQNGKILGEFDKFIKPPDDAEWLPEHCNSHKYTKDDERIVNGKSIKEVWLDYVKFVESYLDKGAKVGMIRGWNGKGCEMTKFFKITFVQYRGELHMPRWVKYFCDPKQCISHYTRCKLHETKRKSRVQGYALGTVYEEAMKRPLVGAHNSKVDCHGQLEICLHPYVKKFLDEVVSVQLIEDVWKGKRARQAVMEEEPTRALPLGWEDSPAATYPIPSDLQYTGANGGGVCGPSSRVTEACTNRDLSELFLFYFTIPMLSSIATEMNRYGNETSVREVSKAEWRAQSDDNISAEDDEDAEDDNEEDDNGDDVDLESGRPLHWRYRYLGDDASYDSSEDSDYETEDEDDDDDEPRRRTYLVECAPNHPQARKRAWGGEWIPVTPGMLLVFFGIMIITIGALKHRFWDIAWMEKRALNYSWIQNMMTRDAFQQCRRFLHFVNNKTLVPKGHPNYSPLRKIQPFIDKMLIRFRDAYVMGQYISLDESMIKYKGKQIQFVQYMPAKPIKHGIKVFAICCGETGYIYGFYVYTGKQNDPNGSPRKVLKKLLDQDPSFLTNSAGRIVFMDNYYTSEDVMRMCFDDYKMFTVGTVKMTKKKSRTFFDYAFHQLSGAAKRLVGRGWLRWAQKRVLDPVTKKLKYIIQCTTWMDNKQVGILHNITVGGPGEFSTYRYDRDERKKVEVKCHPIIPFYVKFMRGVDMIDRAMADWNVSLKSNTFYFRIFWYVFTAALANMRIITHKVVEQSGRLWRGRKDPWKKYLKGNSKGTFDWMLDMGMAIAEKGIRMDWKDLTDDSQRPPYMRKRFLPCNCKICFCCKEGLTTRYGPPVRLSPRKRATSSRFVTPSKSSPPTLRKKARKGRVVEVEADHVQRRVKVCDYNITCGVCLQERRRTKPKGVDKSKTSEKFVNKTSLGCPHIECRGHPVCGEHWKAFKHSWSNSL